MPIDQTSKTEDNIKHSKVFVLPAKPDKKVKKYTDERYHPSLCKPEDQETVRLVPTDQSSLGLWEQAWEQVKTQEEDWKPWPNFGVSRT